MFKDDSNLSSKCSEKLALNMSTLCSKNIVMTGQTIDKIFYKDGRVEEIVGHNLVVDSFTKLVMSLIKNHSGYTGIQYWAIGSGAPFWDSELPNPTKDEIKLTNEIGRVAIDPNNITFVDEDFREVSSPSNILQIVHTFGATDCNGIWREFGIFGGNASSTANSGIMINKRHHAVITKTEDMVIERTIRFTLNLA